MVNESKYPPPSRDCSSVRLLKKLQPCSHVPAVRKLGVRCTVPLFHVHLNRDAAAVPSHPGSLSAIAADIIKRTRNGQNQDDQAGKVLPGPSRLYPEICRCYEVRPPMLKPHQTHTSRSEFFAWTALSAPTLRGFPPPQLSISFYLAK